MILDKIIARTKQTIKEQKAKYSFEDILKDIKKNNFIKKDVAKLLSANKINIIAEVKKASPSKGIIKENFDHVQIAKDYENGGATALSVLTEEHFFLGSPQYLRDIKKNVSIPILRKDFIIDKYQIAQAKLWGADFILLLVNSLSINKLQELYEYAYSLDLEVLVETHSKEELEVALKIDAKIIGINHRDLKTFKMNMNLSLELMEFIPKDKILVAESGIEDKQTILNLQQAGIHAFLIGEFFMKQDDIESTIKAFIS